LAAAAAAAFEVALTRKKRTTMAEGMTEAQPRVPQALSAPEAALGQAHPAQPAPQPMELPMVEVLLL
jgi:hypothetical protein